MNPKYLNKYMQKFSQVISIPYIEHLFTLKCEYCELSWNILSM